MNNGIQPFNPFFMMTPNTFFNQNNTNCLENKVNELEKKVQALEKRIQILENNHQGINIEEKNDMYML